MKRELKASVDIHASPEDVWQVLMDFPGYLEWSKFLLSIEGPAVPGSYLRVRLGNADDQFKVYKPMVLQVTRLRSLRWLANFWVPGLLDWEHGFQLEYLFDGGTRLRQTAIFGGFLAPWVWRRLEPTASEGIAAFNYALKRRVESRV
ncbi:MAG: SRPBCC domain-containing protein [Gammaproteobacteria bacterium]|nr:SRPBCC domain-containing protein [Gammaproteobacteria bacterium]MBU6510654.1 SRPBCC domain-containing protein [Gammaproteobacteria bacterium]MDE1984320.1 SRPBCC domain-containing protein [Gammaproteobacteria bacterium]MDE2109451.1 SRPBCC domain-containing protein [Gammaproteobacteria bacterium]MDE2461499.1 SRPBCC domain-containing protein [Gammaproteobacteria bacterium]